MHPPKDAKTIKEADYDEFTHSKERSEKIFKSVDIDESGHIEDHELHPEIIGLLEWKVQGRVVDEIYHEILDHEVF